MATNPAQPVSSTAASAPESTYVVVDGYLVEIEPGSDPQLRFAKAVQHLSVRLETDAYVIGHRST
jgi:hypothetical protein